MHSFSDVDISLEIPKSSCLIEKTESYKWIRKLLYLCSWHLICCQFSTNEKRPPCSHQSKTFKCNLANKITKWQNGEVIDKRENLTITNKILLEKQIIITLSHTKYIWKHSILHFTRCSYTNFTDVTPWFKAPDEMFHIKSWLGTRWRWTKQNSFFKLA